MKNKEIIEEIFVKTPLHDNNGRICPLPYKACLMAYQLKKDWMKEEFPEGVKPMFSIGPKKLEDGTEGYSLRKEVIYLKSRCVQH